MKTKVTRFSVSMPEPLLKNFDRLVKRKGYPNRSQAVCDIVRDSMVSDAVASGAKEIAGTITLVYDHHKRNLQAELTDIQHDHGAGIIATMHVHLDHNNCMEVLAVRGTASQIQKIGDALIAVKGVKHGTLSMTTTGQDI